VLPFKEYEYFFVNSGKFRPLWQRRRQRRRRRQDAQSAVTVPLSQPQFRVEMRKKKKNAYSR